MVYEYTQPRGPIAAMMTSPGPTYRLPGLTGRSDHDPSSRFVKAPSFPFGARSLSYEFTDGPGPCYMPKPKVYRCGKELSPSCIIINSRTEPKLLITPGPAAYSPCPTNVSSRYARPPAFSIALAETDTARLNLINATPGPAAYNPDQMMGRTVRSTKRTAPGYTISTRSSFGAYMPDDLPITPGPAHYGLPVTDMYKTKSPGHVISGRRSELSGIVNTPGPAAHCPDLNVSSKQRRMPAFSFGIRHSRYCVPAPDINSPPADSLIS